MNIIMSTINGSGKRIMSDPMSDEWYNEVYLPQQGEGMITSWDYVREDINQREEMGALKYGKYLTPNTSEDMLQHLYEELLDATVYIKTLILQRKQEQSAKVPF